MIAIAEDIQNIAEDIACVEFYDHVPDSVEHDLENIYQSIFTTVARMKIDGALAGASTYIVRQGAKARTVLLFRCEGNRVTVYNEQISLENNEIRKFSDAIFSKYKSVSVISFYAINADINKFSRPVQKLNCLEDIVLQLPSTAEAYFKILSENTRASIRKSQKKLQQNLPAIQFETCCKDNVSEQQIRSIIALSHARMSAKKRRFHYDEIAIQKLIKLIRKYGTVVMAKNISDICAGAICYRVGEHYFMHVLAHHPKYNEYGLGKLCCYLSICDAIANGAKSYHFGWGRTNYKYAMGAKNIDLYRIEIYRSSARLAGNIGHFLWVVIRHEIRRYKLWIERLDQGNTGLDKRIVNAIKMLRNVKSYFRPCNKNGDV